MQLRIGTHTREANWRLPWAYEQHSQLSSTLMRWLQDDQSLTKRLQQVSEGRFAVRVVDQRWALPLRTERQLLAMDERHFGLIRQVFLLCNNQPWVFARTVIPPAFLKGSLRRFAHLKARPLGAMLFAQKSLRRGALQIARINPGEALFAEAMAAGQWADQSVWARRSAFHIKGRSLLVNEIFLPAMTRYLAECDGEGAVTEGHKK